MNKEFWENKRKVSIAMRKYGGGFVHSLGTALRSADQANTVRIKEAFPEYWDKYLGLYNEQKDRDGI